MKILVAEDDRATRVGIAGLLESWGHQVEIAENGDEAWKLFRKAAPDILLTDWVMPELDGLELVKRVKEVSPEAGQYTYILMLTSQSDTEDLVLALESGADDFIAKPFEHAELQARIQAGARIVELEHDLENKNRSLAEANAEISESNRRMKEELDAAAMIQTSYLPTTLPATERATFAWHHEPCEELSGDTLNIMPLDDGRIGIYMVDVCGHGVSAALMSVHVSRLFTQSSGGESITRKPSSNGHDGVQAPSEVAASLNRQFTLDPRVSDKQFFTLLYGILDLGERRFDYSSAGHPGPILVPADSGREAFLHEADPPAVGFFPDASFCERRVPLEPGDRLYLYTDGVFEVQNGRDEEFGESRLARELGARRGAPLDESIREVLELSRQWSGREQLEDDVSLIGIEVA